MERTPAGSKTVASPVVYAGRFFDRIAGLPEGWPVLDDWDVLPARLAAHMERATVLVLLDPLSFPFEAMTREQWDVPLVVVLPQGFDAVFLQKVLGRPLLERLTFFDRVVAPEGSPVWKELRRRYRWTEAQLIAVGDERPEEAVAQVCALLDAEREVPVFFDDTPASAARREIFSDKATHRAQRSVLAPQFAAARGDRAGDVPFDVLEVGAGDGRWAFGFDPAKTRFSGVDVGEDAVAAGRADFPEASFERLGPDLLLPYEDEGFDLVFCVGVVQHYPTQAKRALLSEMWRVARPGGRLLFLEDFVAVKGSAVYTVSVLEFVELLLEATNGQVVLEHVESLRYPREDATRGGVISVSRLGVPKKW